MFVKIAKSFGTSQVMIAVGIKTKFLQDSMFIIR